MEHLFRGRLDSKSITPMLRGTLKTQEGIDILKTQKAIHSACKHARQDTLPVFLVKFMDARHLGRSLVHWPKTRIDKRLINFRQAQLEPSLAHAV